MSFYQFRPTSKKMSKNVTEMIITLRKKEKTFKIYLFADSNDLSQELNYKLVQSLCEKHTIPFRNQSFPGVIKELREKHINTKNGRIIFTLEQRQELLNKHPNCNLCNIELTMEKFKDGSFNIDHITPFSQTQDNSESNLQLICLPCHYDKTASEKLNLEHEKVSRTHSSYNEETGKIFKSSLAQSLAFVEIIGVSPFINRKNDG